MSAAGDPSPWLAKGASPGCSGCPWPRQQQTWTLLLAVNHSAPVFRDLRSQAVIAQGLPNAEDAWLDRRPGATVWEALGEPGHRRHAALSPAPLGAPSGACGAVDKRQLERAQRLDLQATTPSRQELRYAGLRGRNPAPGSLSRSGLPSTVVGAEVEGLATLEDTSPGTMDLI